MLPLLMLPLLVLMGGTGAAKRDLTVSKFDNAHIPWYHTGTKPLYYEGDSFVNSLPALLGVQQLKNWVTVFMFNRAVQRWALNCIYSYIKFGKARNYIVAATDESSLEACIQLRLPCYNASFVLGAQGASLSNSHLLISTDDYITMVWGKVMVLQRILDLHYNVHFSDVDVVYMRPVWPSYRQLFLRAQPDAIFMKETTMLDMVESPQVPGHEVSASGASRKREDERDPVGRINLFNTGVYAMRSNNGTRALVDTWLSMRKNEGLLNDQVMLNERAMKDYVVCESRATCAAARMAGKPAVLRHPTQFGPQGACPGKWDAPCEPIRLFVHVICRTGWDTGGEETKGRVLERYRLWLLDEALKPVYNEDDQARRHPFLPCQGPAWENYGTGQ